MKRLVLVIIAFLFILSLFSETRNFSRWSITGEYGVTYFFGDLAPQLPSIFPATLQEAVFGATVEYNLSPVWGLSVDYYHLPISGKNQIAYFKTDLSNSDLNATINFTKFIFPQTKSKFSVNGAIGIGLAVYSSQYRYPDPDNSPLVVSPNPSYVSSVPVSFLFEYNFSNSIALGIRANYRAYFSDNLEGVPYLNFNGVTNDNIGVLSMSLRYKFVAIKKNHMRNINMEDFVTKTNSEIEKNDSCSACTAIALSKENANSIYKIEKNDKDMRRQLDSVLLILSNYRIDSDGDGLPDFLDKCPKISGKISDNGCPEVKKEVKALFKQALQGIQFETAKADIKPLSSVILNKIVNVLILNTSYLIEIQGHTDNVGKSDANLVLSENRAEAVRNYLIEKGVSDKRFTSHGYGDTKPVANNNTIEGRTKNRRVEFIVSFEK